MLNSRSFTGTSIDTSTPSTPRKLSCRIQATGYSSPQILCLSSSPLSYD